MDKHKLGVIIPHRNRLEHLNRFLTCIKTYLNLLKITPREFEDDMRTNGVLIHDKKARLTTGWKSAVSPVNINAYWFKTPIPTEWLNGDPDADS